MNFRPLVLLLALPACATQKITQSGPIVELMAVKTIRVWHVHKGDTEVGQLHLLEIQSKPPVRVFRVQRPGGQVAGWIDLQLRAFRAEPFLEDQVLVRQTVRDKDSNEVVAEAAFAVRRSRVLVAMDTMAEDLRVLLELRNQPTLTPFEQAAPELGR